MPDIPVMNTPGEVIGAARRAQGLSLADLAERTKIPGAMLEAIESDAYHRLSGPLYIKSFLRACAGELGLEPQSVLDLYARHCGEQEKPAEEPVWAEEQVRIRKLGFPWVRVSMVTLAAAALAVTVVFVVGRCSG